MITVLLQKQMKKSSGQYGCIMVDYGHFDDETPSVAISLYKDYRGLGIGTHLMKKDLGFEVYEDKPEEYIMVYYL